MTCSKCGLRPRMDGRSNTWCTVCKSEWQREYRKGARRLRSVPDPVPDQNGCLNWQGFITVNGYGQKTAGGKRYYAHRYAYEQQRGPISEALVIDHLCSNRRCVNVEHMEVVTIAENTRRGSKKRWERERGCSRGAN